MYFRLRPGEGPGRGVAVAERGEGGNWPCPVANPFSPKGHYPWRDKDKLNGRWGIGN